MNFFKANLSVREGGAGRLALHRVLRAIPIQKESPVRPREPSRFRWERGKELEYGGRSPILHSAEDIWMDIIEEGTGR